VSATDDAKPLGVRIAADYLHDRTRRGSRDLYSGHRANANGLRLGAAKDFDSSLTLAATFEYRSGDWRADNLSARADTEFFFAGLSAALRRPLGSGDWALRPSVAAGFAWNQNDMTRRVAGLAPVPHTVILDGRLNQRALNAGFRVDFDWTPFASKSTRISPWLSAGFGLDWLSSNGRSVGLTADYSLRWTHRGTDQRFGGGLSIRF